MRSVLWLGVFGLMGCESDSGVKVFNASPEANITSHENWAEVKEATDVVFRGAGADPDHDQTELVGSWQLGADILCDWTPLDEDGVNECTVTVTTDLTEITFLVRDPADSVASANINLTGTPDADPQAEITSPSYDPATDEEIPPFWGDEPVELVGVVSDEEDAADTLTVEWTTDADEEIGTTPADSSGTTRASAYLSEGIHTITLTVTDSAGNFTSDTLDIQVGPDNPAGAPDVSITSPDVLPGDRPFYYGDQAIEFEGLVTDDEDAPDTINITWSSDTDGEIIATTPDSDGTTALTAHLTRGLHTITLSATDSDGKVGSDTINIEVGPDNTPPNCMLLTPEDGSTGMVGDLVVFGGTVADPDISVDSITVEWKDGDEPIGTSIPTSAGNVSLPLTELTPGAHVISMTAADEMGATCTDNVIYTVLALPEANNPPSATITAPDSGTIKTEGDTLLFEATISDVEDAPGDLLLRWNSSIDGVLHTDAADSSGGTRFTTSSLSVGDHTIELTVTDTAGAFSTDIVVLQIEEAATEDTPENTAPVVTLINPVDGRAVEEGDTVVFSADVYDAEDALSALTISWNSSLDGGLAGAAPDASGRVNFTDDTLSVGEHIITVTVTDTEGLTANGMAVLTVDEPSAGTGGGTTGGGETGGSETGGDDEDEDFLEEGDELPPELEGGTYTGCEGFDRENIVIFGAIDAALFCACGFDEAENVKISSSGEADIDLSCLDIIEGDLEIDLSGANHIDLSSVASVGDGLNIHDNYATEVIDLSAMTSIGGAFNLNNNVDLEELHLTALETIEGEFQINSNSSLAILSVPNVTTIEGSLRFNSNNGIEEIHFDKLTAIEGQFRFEYNHYVETLSLPSVETINSQLYMYSNDRLESIDMRSLQEIGSYLEIQYNYQVDTLNLSSLQYVNGYIQMYSMNQLSELALPALEEVNGNFNVSNMSKIEFLSAPALYDLSGSLTIRDNIDLEGVDLSSLECIDDFTIVGNNMTPEVLHELLLQLSCDEPGSEVIFRTEDAAALCASGEDIVVSDLYVYAIDPEPLDLRCIVDITGRLEIEFSDATTIDLSRAAGVGDSINIHDNYDTDEIWLNAISSTGESFSLNNNIALSVLNIDALTEVGGEMTLNSNSGLGTLYAPNLEVIEGSLRFNSNNGIERIDLPTLAEVNGQFRFEYNHYVQDLLLPSLETINSQLYMYSNDRLETVNMESLIETGSYIEMQYNYQVKEVSFDSLETVNGYVQMYSLNQVSSLEMPSLLEVNGNFNLSNNSKMESFSAPLFEELTGSLTIRDNTDLQTVDLSSLACIDDFTIVGNDLTIDSHHALLLALTCSSEGSLIIFRDTDADEFCATGETVVNDLYISPIDSGAVDLSCITEITGQVEIEFSKASSIDISNAASIKDSLNIHDNYDTDTIDFTRLVSIGESFYLSNNRDLASLVIDSLDLVDGQLYLSSNNNLETFSAPALSTVEGSLQFSSNNGIEEVQLDALTNLAGEFRFESNNNVRVVSIPALTEIEGQLYVQYNDNIETLNLGSLETINSSLQIQYNYKMEEINLSALSLVNGSFQMYALNQVEDLNLAGLTEVNGSFNVSNFASLKSLTAPLLDELVGSLTIRDNPDLATIDLTSLTCVDDYTVVGNDMDDDDTRDLLLHIISDC